MPDRRWFLALFALALLVGTGLAVIIRQPGYTDAYYMFNTGQRFATGQGLTAPYLWTYIDAPASLPAPSHRYWMPLASLAAASSMALGSPAFGWAQIPFVACYAGLVVVGAWVSATLGRKRRHALTSGLLVLFSGYYMPFWTNTDTFALFGLLGSMALLSSGQARTTANWRWYALGGALSGLAHLTRPDGVLLLGVLFWAALWPTANHRPRRQQTGLALVAAAAYLAIMLPWFARNLAELGTPLATGGTQTIWLRGYDEIVSYPARASAQSFWDWGWSNILASRWEALLSNLGTFLAAETWGILGPFVVAGIWLRRREPLLSGVVLYAIILHGVMTVVFAYPGYRGGLFHSASALLPFWAGTGVVGLERGIDWMAARRRWPLPQAQIVFNSALVVIAIGLSAFAIVRQVPSWNTDGSFYRALARDLPPKAVVILNDPAALYFHTGLQGLAVPDSDPDIVSELAARYGATHLVLDRNRTNPFSGLYEGSDTRPYLRLTGTYGTGTADPSDDRRVFEIMMGQQP
jgi:hypothetical protein